MLNDIIAAYSRINRTWDDTQTKKVQRSNSSAFNKTLAKAVNKDTIELSSKAPSLDSMSEINTEKLSIASELSNIHSDVNKFLEIKNQVRSGTYELNAEEIAKGISQYSIF